MEFTQLPAMTVAAIMHRGKHVPSHTGDTWEQLILWASSRRLLGRDMEVRAVGLLWDDPRAVDPEDRRYHVAVPIDPEDIGDVDSPAIPLVTMPGEFLHVRHTGAYERLPDTYDQALGLSLSASGLRLLAAPILELYRNSPAEVEEDELVTDIYLPVIEYRTW